MTQPQTVGIREYELIYVLRPNVDSAEAEKVNGKVTEIVESFGGKLTKLDNWGRRRLAYPIQKNARGLFVYAKYLGAGGVVAEVERALRITDSVLRHQTVLIRRDVDPNLVEVNPEELQFEPIEEAEPEEEVSYEQRLGLVSAPRKSDRAESEGSDKRASAEGQAAPGEGEAKADAEAETQPEVKADAKADAEAETQPEAKAAEAATSGEGAGA